MEQADSVSSCTEGELQSQQPQEQVYADDDNNDNNADDDDGITEEADIDRDSYSCCDNPTRDALTEGLLSLIKPHVDILSDKLIATSNSQIELNKVIESLAEELNKVKNLQLDNSEFEDYIKKLANCKRKITVVSTLLQNTQERLEKIYPLAEAEHKRRQALLNIDSEPGSSGTGKSSNETVNN